MVKFYFFILLFLLSCSKIEKENRILRNGDKIYQKAELMFSKNNDSAFFYFNNAYGFYLIEKDSLNCANSLIYQSIIQNEKGDYFGAEETNINALKFLQNKNINQLSIYNEIAISRKNLKDYKTALIWYEKALKISTDSLEKIKIQNNIAVAYSKLKDYKKSIEIFESLLNLKLTNQDKKIKSKIIDNLAFTKFLQNKNYNAEPELNKALKIREEENDLWGQNASHAHLADYFKEKNPEKSLFHAHKMYEIAGQLKSPDDEIEALQKLVNLESTANSKKYFSIYLKLNDSLQTARNKAKNQFALVRYESEKNRADLLKSQAENTEKNYQLLVRNVALGLAFLAIIISFIWFEKRRKRVKQEKELLLQENQLKVKNTELKYSKKVHDVVANGLYQIIVEIQNQLKFNKENILNKIEVMYEKSRDIAHENINETLEKNFSMRLFEMINSYSSDNQKVFLNGNNQNLWQEVSENTKTELFYVIREILTNMKKHSKAKIVSLKFQKEQGFLSIKYTDNGIGITDFKNFKGSGIKNTENRMEVLGGEINFEQNIKGGLIIHITVPIH